VLIAAYCGECLQGQNVKGRIHENTNMQTNPSSVNAQCNISQ